MGKEKAGDGKEHRGRKGVSLENGGQAERN